MMIQFNSLLLMCRVNSVIIIIIIIIIKFLFICMLTQQLKGQLQSEHE
jgi:hypothetical protein